MHVVTRDAAPSYGGHGRTAVESHRLQGQESGGPQDYWVGVSHYAPGATVELSPVVGETVYVVVEGQLEIAHHDGTHEKPVTLCRLDSAHLLPGEVRSVRNASDRPATLLILVHPRHED